MMPSVVLLAFLSFSAAHASLAIKRVAPADMEFNVLRSSVLGSKVFEDKVSNMCKSEGARNNCHERATSALFCELLERTRPDVAQMHCIRGVLAFIQNGSITQATAQGSSPTKAKQNSSIAKATVQNSSAHKAAAQTQPIKSPALTMEAIRHRISSAVNVQTHAEQMTKILGCAGMENKQECLDYAQDAAFCVAFMPHIGEYGDVTGAAAEYKHCANVDKKVPQLSLIMPKLPTLGFVQVHSSMVAKHSMLSKQSAPEDELAKEMTHDLEMNFNKIAPFGKEDTAKELQDHAAKTQDTLVDAVENAEVAEIKRAVFRALTRLRAATIKEFDTIARLETQAIDAYNDAHHYRAENPLAHLHEDEAPVETDKLKSFH